MMEGRERLVTPTRFAPAALAAWCAGVGLAAAQADDPHANCAKMGWVPQEILERPVALRSGTGNAHERVSTSSGPAQALYDQGLNYLHGYVWIEAARSFRQALRADPGLSMAWLGLSRVYSGLDDPQHARQALAQAEALAAPSSARERRRIALRAKQLEAMADLGDATRHAAYKKAIDEALAVDIDDAELWLVRGNAEEASAAGRGQRGAAASTAFYREALRLAPDSSAAHHYLTHSYETVGQIPLALEHGEAYARLAPAVPHAHHMWGHDLRRVGRIDEAIAAFRRTEELEKAYYAAEAIRPELDWHHVHNLDLLATSYQHKGRMKQAEALMREAAALPPTTDYLEFNQKVLAVFLLGRERWDDSLAEARRLTGGKWSATRAIGHALAGQAQLARGQVAEGRASLERAEHELAQVSALTAGIGVSRGQVRPWIDVLRAELLLREGRGAEARPILEEVARTLRAIPGPDAWIQALFRLEAMARLARDVGDWELAEFMALQMIEHDPAYARVAPRPRPRRRTPRRPGNGGPRALRGRALLGGCGPRPAGAGRRAPSRRDHPALSRGDREAPTEPSSASVGAPEAGLPTSLPERRGRSRGGRGGRGRRGRGGGHGSWRAVRTVAGPDQAVVVLVESPREHDPCLAVDADWHRSQRVRREPGRGVRDDRRHGRFVGAGEDVEHRRDELMREDEGRVTVRRCRQDLAGLLLRVGDTTEADRFRRPGFRVVLPEALCQRARNVLGRPHRRSRAGARRLARERVLQYRALPHGARHEQNEARPGQPSHLVPHGISSCFAGPEEDHHPGGRWPARQTGVHHGLQ